MEKLFVPYKGESPAVVDVNGHRVVVVSLQEDAFSQSDLFRHFDLREFSPDSDDVVLAESEEEPGALDRVGGMFSYQGSFDPVVGGDDGIPGFDPELFQGGIDVEFSQLTKCAARIAGEVHGGVVFVPEDASPEEVLEELAEALPWVN